VVAAANLATLPSHDDPAAPGAIIGAVCCGWNAYKGTQAAIDVPLPKNDKLTDVLDFRLYERFKTGPDAAALAARAARVGGDRIYYVDAGGRAQAARFTAGGVTFDTSTHIDDGTTQLAIDEWLARNPDRSIVALTGVHGTVVDIKPGTPGFEVPTGRVAGNAPNELSRFKGIDGMFGDPKRVIVVDISGIHGFAPRGIGGFINSMERAGYGVCQGWCYSSFSNF
jgi:hypothetical protein